MDVTAWAVSQGLPVRELFPPVIEETQPHLGDDAAAQNEFTRHLEFLKRPQTLIAIEGAFIRDATGIVELPDGRVCYEGNWWLPLLQEHPAYRRRFFLKQRRLDGNWYSLQCLWSSEYYHWFHDVLPRLENALPYLPANTRFLINETPRAFQLESLKAYGIPVGKLEFQPPGIRTRIECLWFATPVGHSTLGSGKVIRQVAGRLKNFFLDDQPHTPLRRIYVSRQKALSRRIVNEVELQSALKEHGFDPMVLEDLTWLEQLQLFSNTEAIMGPHGAGLMNMIFAKENAVIYEISALAKTVPCYLVLAGQLNYKFQRLQARAAGDETTADMRVLPEDISRLFKINL
ncbi:MAG: glycosyltransferase family 61 protein [Limisphaerales bacterium]